MRADRLLALLMLLQSRGRMTAEALAEELEVSVRTVYRDLEALGAAGVPVYAERGPGGGCQLIENYRTTLTGLTEDETRALFMLSIPAALVELGVGEELKAAWRKLSAALPDAWRGNVAWVRQRVYLDWGEGEPSEAAPALACLQRGVWDNRRVWTAYTVQYGGAEQRVERGLDPYGLVARGGAWYVVAGGTGRPRVYPVARLLDARLTDERFERPADFDLAAFWRGWWAENGRQPLSYAVRLRVSPALARAWPSGGVPHADLSLAEADPPDADGWRVVTWRFESIYAARSYLLTLGGAVEVLDPLPLRLSLADYARQISALYDSYDRGDGQNGIP